MNAKEYLDTYRELYYKAKRLYSKYRSEIADIDCIGSSANYDNPKTSKHISRIPEKRAISLSMSRELWQIAALDALAKRQEIFSLINEIPSEEADILFHRYISLLNWRDVCSEMQASWPTIRNKHSIALSHIQELLDQAELS